MKTIKFYVIECLLWILQHPEFLDMVFRFFFVWKTLFLLFLDFFQTI
jgi:hypothetical protein